MRAGSASTPNRASLLGEVRPRVRRRVGDEQVRDAGGVRPRDDVSASGHRGVADEEDTVDVEEDSRGAASLRLRRAASMEPIVARRRGGSVADPLRFPASDRPEGAGNPPVEDSLRCAPAGGRVVLGSGEGGVHEGWRAVAPERPHPLERGTDAERRHVVKRARHDLHAGRDAVVGEAGRHVQAPGSGWTC